MPHGRACKDPGDGVRGLALGSVGVARLGVNRDRFVILRDVVVILEPDSVKLELFSFDFSLIISTSIQTGKKKLKNKLYRF